MKPRTQDLAPILDALPAELVTANSPASCDCTRCRPDLTEAERDTLHSQVTVWATERRDWCAANGYTVLALLVAEITARQCGGRPVV
ncbi:hypothetical protein ASG49_16205 [Marmoricola sp. Leaf446]|nr:hypothetical protein ASG49_16205 [Marmoricola sp. Leaf446]